MIYGVGLNPVGNNVAAAQREAMLQATRQAQQGVQLTDFTHIEVTEGPGIFYATVMFDVAFTAEPVFKHGMTLPSGTVLLTEGDVPTCSAYVQRWLMNGSTYVGAEMMIVVRLPGTAGAS